ncbi:MAG: class II aldolase/adducin family protein, partial [Pararhodobacter sp.]|nr:class II aldolase/adducin family protein [Pararhodobacter sp.]
PFGRLFARMKATELILLDANDPATLERPEAPDPTAWGLHGAIHRACKHARCVMHVHSIHATVLACLQDSRLPPVDQNSAMFFGRHVVDERYGGMALGDEAARCAALLADPKIMVMVMGNHGVLAVGPSVAEAFHRLYYFERAAETYIRALRTGRPLRVMSDELAEKTAREWEAYPGFAAAHLREIKAILREEGSNFEA